MITIDIDAMALKAIDRKLEDMVEAIDHLKHVDLAAELGEWETSDLRRKRAYVKRRRAGASTMFGRIAGSKPKADARSRVD